MIETTGAFNNTNSEVSIESGGVDWPCGEFWIEIRDSVASPAPFQRVAERARAQVVDGSLVLTRSDPYAHDGSPEVVRVVVRSVTVDCSDPDAAPVVVEE